MKKVFKMPKPIKITQRSSSITNAFVNGIIPCIQPTDSEIQEALKILGMTEDTICCVYCGNQYTEWDHFRPLVVNKKPTGYISNIYNLVPACGKCNQSKGNSNWKDWMQSDAPLSPKTRNVERLDEKIKRLEAYEKWHNVTPIDFGSIVGKEKWEQHWNNWKEILDKMEASQTVSDEIKKIIAEKTMNS